MALRSETLPSVDRVLADPRLADVPRPLALAAARAALDRARAEIRAGGDPGDLVEATLAHLTAAARPSLRRVLNATGVLIHTNLGRAPLAPSALDRVVEVGGSYSNLEYDLDTGARGSRQDHLTSLLHRITDAEASLVVNNCAAAVMLALAALAEGREVLVSRGELIEIGDGFRIPDVLARSGARLVEVGTTNRTRIADYERAIGPETAVILRVHQSNFRVVGFTEQPELAQLAELAKGAGLPLVDDLGSGALSAIGDESTAGGEPRRGSRPRLLLRRQAARWASGGDPRRPRRSDRAPPPAPAAAGAAGRQADVGRARGDARPCPRSRARPPRDPGAPHARRARRRRARTG